jgi:hypothetical protein
MRQSGLAPHALKDDLSIALSAMQHCAQVRSAFIPLTFNAQGDANIFSVLTDL